MDFMFLSLPQTTMKTIRSCGLLRPADKIAVFNYNYVRTYATSNWGERKGALVLWLKKTKNLLFRILSRTNMEVMTFVNAVREKGEGSDT